jgi:hypothetical protein
MEQPIDLGQAQVDAREMLDMFNLWADALGL